MKRLAIGVLALSAALGACAPNFAPLSGPDAEATAAAANSVYVAQTMAALPTPTVLPTSTPVISTPSLTATPVTPTTTVTATAVTSSVTVTVTGTINASATSTVTGTPPPGTVTITPTDPMVPRFYGTQPPYIHYGRIKLVNQSKSQVYVSFQCTTPEGYYVIVEYPVGGTVKVSVPAGRCIYVAWVGGRQFEGSFGLGRFEELTMTFKKNSVNIH